LQFVKRVAGGMMLVLPQDTLIEILKTYHPVFVYPK